MRDVSRPGTTHLDNTKTVQIHTNGRPQSVSKVNTVNQAIAFERMA